jgi:type IV pilus assembly protein PilB
MRIGDALVEAGAVTPEQLRRALAEQRSTGPRVGELLVEQGIVSPSALVQALAPCRASPAAACGTG